MDELEALVDAILRSPRIKGKLVVLCEGDRLPLQGGVAPSPQMYGRLETMPDANFYKACVPRDWHNYRLPQFFNCGGRSDVLRAYTALLTAHREHRERSYLTPEKLYVLVDLDIQPGPMPDEYPWRTTEDVHTTLYDDGTLKADPDERHRVWVTALIHKEAFFLLPSSAESWQGGPSPYFQGAPLEMRALHAAIARRLEDDEDVTRNLDAVRARLTRFIAGSHMDCLGGEELARSWLVAAANAVDVEYEALVRALFAVAKVKPLWSEIMPDPNLSGTLPAETFREQIALNVARSIAVLAPEAHPLAGFFAWLKPRR